MRKLVTAIVVGFFLAIGFGGAPAEAQNGGAVFKFNNNSKYIIMMKLYSQNRKHVWPGPREHWNLSDNARHSFPIFCNRGEKICFGGSYTENDDPRWWGVGFRGNKPCQGCCLVCGSFDNPPEHAWNLVE